MTSNAQHDALKRLHVECELARPVEIGIVGIFDGTDAPDSRGSYVKLATFRGDNEDRREFRISIGCAEVFAAELTAALAASAQPTRPSRPIITTHGVEHEDWLLGQAGNSTSRALATVECDCERSHNGFGIMGRECDCRENDAPPTSRQGVGEVEAFLAMTRGYEIMQRVLFHIVGTSGASEGWYRAKAHEAIDRIDPLWKVTAASNKARPGDCLTQASAFIATHVLPAQPGFAVDTFLTKAEEQVAYWRERQTREKCIGDAVGENGEYTPIGDDAAWDGGYCNGRYSEADWWLKTILAAIGEPRQWTKTDVERCGFHRGLMRAEELAATVPDIAAAIRREWDPT